MTSALPDRFYANFWAFPFKIKMLPPHAEGLVWQCTCTRYQIVQAIFPGEKHSFI